MRHARRRRERAFTLLELLIVVGIIVVLLGILVPVVANVRRSARSVQCLSNLHNIAVAFQQYAAANNDRRLPNPLASDSSWEQVLRPYAQATDVYRCPADDELFPSIGSSYDWRDTGDPATTLAGQRFGDASSGTVLAYDGLPNWHAKGMMNAVMADGSASSMATNDCLKNVMTPLRPAAAPPPGGTTRP